MISPFRQAVIHKNQVLAITRGGQKAAVRKKRKYNLLRPAAKSKIQKCEPLWKQEGLCAPSGRQQLCLGFGGMHARHVVIDAAPFHQWYENHYLQPLDKKRDLKAS
ncbi:hypothetical protein quinque_014030 [Culex quinquefasciatus]